MTLVTLIRQAATTAGAMVAALCLAAFACAQPDDEDEEPEFRPGLVACYAGGEIANARLSRCDLVINFDWGSSSPDPRLPVGDFDTTWRGKLFVMAPGDYRFHLYLEGTAELTIAGTSVLNTKTNVPA